MKAFQCRKNSLFTKRCCKKNGPPYAKNKQTGTSLVVQWLRICLPVQGTQVRSLVWEDSTCLRAIKPVHHDYWACSLEPSSHNYWRLRTLGPVCHNYWARVLQPLKPTHCNEEHPPLSATRGSPRAAMKTQHTQKFKKIKNKQKQKTPQFTSHIYKN